MRQFFSLRLWLPFFLVCLLHSPGWGAAGYESCLMEESRLSQAEAEACSGLSYIVNPSACFNIRKQLSPYARGKCREVAASEEVVEPQAEPVKAVESPAAPPVSPVAAGAPATPVVSAQAIAELKREIAALREEIGLLKKEVARLKGEQQ